MKPGIETTAQDDAWRFVQAINACWVEGRPEDLDQFFDEQIVFVAPGFQHRIEGRAACVESFRDFCSKARVHDLKVNDPGVDIFGGTAVVTYGFVVEYALDSETFSESGRDVWVLSKRDAKWNGVWRTIVTGNQ